MLSLIRCLLFRFFLELAKLFTESSLALFKMHVRRLLGCSQFSGQRERNPLLLSVDRLKSSAVCIHI